MRTVPYKLLYNLRDGRFFWLPEAVSEGILDLRATCLLLRDSSEYIVDPMSAVEAMETLKWWKQPSRNHLLPEIIGQVTPLYAGRDWVLFNARE